MSDELEPRIRTWIRKGGVPLEYETARVLARAGFDVVQGRSYPARAPGGDVVHREIDVIGTVATFNDSAAASLVVECKRTGERPWVVLTNSHPLTTDEVLSSIVAHDLARMALARLHRRSRGRGLPEFLSDTPRRGFSSLAADLSAPTTNDPKDDGRNRARDAMAQVVGAAHGVLASRSGEWSLTWPVVLIDGPLYELDFAEDGTEQLVAVDWKRVLWHASPYGTPVALDIVREPELQRYASRAQIALSMVVQRLADAYAEYNDPANVDDYGQPKALKD